MLCDRHLLGEHYEIHKAVGNLRHTGRWARALTADGFLEPQNFVARHDALVVEMLRRGMRHQSPLRYRTTRLAGTVDVGRSVRDLRERCTACRTRLNYVP